MQDIPPSLVLFSRAIVLFIAVVLYSGLVSRLLSSRAILWRDTRSPLALRFVMHDDASSGEYVVCRYFLLSPVR
jgi:hypothetical protein